MQKPDEASTDCGPYKAPDGFKVKGILNSPLDITQLYVWNLLFAYTYEADKDSSRAWETNNPLSLVSLYRWWHLFKMSNNNARELFGLTIDSEAQTQLEKLRDQYNKFNIEKTFVRFMEISQAYPKDTIMMVFESNTGASHRMYRLTRDDKLSFGLDIDVLFITVTSDTKTKTVFHTKLDEMVGNGRNAAFMFIMKPKK